MNPPVVPSVTLPRIEKPAKQSADIINFYFKSKEQVLLVVLVFIFSFFSVNSVANAGMQEKLKKRDILVACSNAAQHYGEQLVKQPKFKALALREKAECDITKDKIAEAKEKLRKAIKIFPNDFGSTYLLLQIEFEESVAEDPSNPKINMPLFKTLINRVKDDWPTRDFKSDPYYYIQEVGSILTPYLPALLYDFHSYMNQDSPLDQSIFTQMVELIGDEAGCLKIIKKVQDKVDQYRIKNASKKLKPINNEAYKVYNKQSDAMKKLVCPKIKEMKKFNPSPLEDNPDETL